ncbi:Pyridoxamine 5'-phosphate oxidase-related FMN-binding protein [Pseudodesulfovibrio profundus]|uniref:Pyridoxamine 5'-phosphate oxidase-related FMN-binding protein n=1 Tax=Pseudodesulfovibrio profundus TaxID=57320 RepID=A0A2C8FCP1_9BACT|nr:pyridoxamine 5'-phosphate oxidase family protein [Pseudodesulfovibrio profundus]SOB59833.1 Pyridoxamine 5'-phosphate oxidase-related FMN-binding protein [Pseudodesulfovibrio profundus]
MGKRVSDDAEAIRNVLDKADVLWLALTDETGPYCVPVNFAMEEGVIYIHSGKKGRKAAILNTEAQVAFSAAVDVEAKTGDTICSYGYRFRSVAGTGIPRLLEADEARVGLDIIIRKYAGKLMPYTDKMLAATAVYAIPMENASVRIKE